MALTAGGRSAQGDIIRILVDNDPPGAAGVSVNGKWKDIRVIRVLDDVTLVSDYQLPIIFSVATPCCNYRILKCAAPRLASPRSTAALPYAPVPLPHRSRTAFSAPTLSPRHPAPLLRPRHPVPAPLLSPRRARARAAPGHRRGGCHDPAAPI